jgi:hypothetical protein
MGSHYFCDGRRPPLQQKRSALPAKSAFKTSSTGGLGIASYNCTEFALLLNEFCDQTGPAGLM